MATMKAHEVAAGALLGDAPDEAAIDAYQAVGAIVVRDLISSEWIGKLRQCYGALADSAIDPFDRSGFADDVEDVVKINVRDAMWREDGPFRDFLFQSPIGQAAAVLMRSQTAQLYEDLLLTQGAGVPVKSNWHQDEPTWPMSGRMLSSVWFSLEAVDAMTGAMRFVDASHRGPLYQPDFIQDAGSDARFWTGGAFPDVDADPDRFGVVQTDIRPGDVVVFHPRSIHTSYGSAASHARRSFSIRFMGDDVRWLPKEHGYHAWMRDLGLKEGDRIVSPQLPMVWSA